MRHLVTKPGAGVDSAIHNMYALCRLEHAVYSLILDHKVTVFGHRDTVKDYVLLIEEPLCLVFARRVQFIFEVTEEAELVKPLGELVCGEARPEAKPRDFLCSLIDIFYFLLLR